MTALGVTLLIVSSLSFTRGMQRLYEGVFDLAKLGIRNTPRAVLWLLVVTAFVALRPPVLDLIPDGWLHAAATLAVSTLLWLITPYLLLGWRVSGSGSCRERC